MSTWNAEYQRTRYETNRARAIEFLGGRCAQCGEQDEIKLEFDHSDPALKTRYVGTTLRWAWDRIVEFLVQEEIQLLCVTCHSAKTELDNHPRV